MEKGSFLRLAGDLIGKSYADVADEARHTRSHQFRRLLEQRRLPEEPWDDLAVTLFLEELANADSNNHLGNVGVGEREGRIFSSLVARRNFHFSHGIGRSGDIAALQPKAAGSSLLFALTRRLVLDAIHVCGIQAARAALPVPFATGLSLTLCFSALRTVRPPSARFIIFSRIDQKACLKSIYSAGFQAEVVDMVRAPGGFALQTDLDAIEDAIDRLKADTVLCVLSTTSTFAPREPDRVDAIARAIRTGRVDAFVQSTDKNFLTPVGGAIIASGDPSSIQRIAATYPGRAGSGPILDLFITLLQLGKSGLRRLLDERRELYLWFKGELEKVCQQTGSRILPTPKNRISIALDLSFLAEAPRGESVSGETTGASREKRTEGRVTTEQERQEEERLLTFFGSALFRRRCSGLRVVPCYAQPASPPPDTLSPDSSFSPRSSSSRLPPTALPGVPPSANSSSSSSSSCSSSVRVPSSCGSSATEGEVAHAEAPPSESGETHAGRDDTARQNEAGQYFFSLTPGGTLKDRKSPCNTKTICGHTFSNYGSHCETFPVPYCTVAVAIGAKKQELEAFLPRFLRVIEETKKAKIGTK